MHAALLQINPTVGALSSNADLIIEEAHRAAEAGADLIITPECALSGYPPEDLILKDHFCSDCQHEINRLLTELPKHTPYFSRSPASSKRKKT